MVQHQPSMRRLPYSLIEACADLLPIVGDEQLWLRGGFSLAPAEQHCALAAERRGDCRSIVLSIFENERARARSQQLLSTLPRLAREYSTDAMVSKIEAEYCALASASWKKPG